MNAELVAVFSLFWRIAHGAFRFTQLPLASGFFDHQILREEKTRRKGYVWKYVITPSCTYRRRLNAETPLDPAEP